MFDFCNSVIQQRKQYYIFQDIEKIRFSLLNNDKKILITDFGTGKNNREKTIKSIAQKTIKSPEIAQILFRIVAYQNPKTILELGTSLGITTAYLAAYNKNIEVTSLEGCPNTVSIAKENFKKLFLNNINVQIGNIDQTLSQYLQNRLAIDLIYIDANHTQEATLRYFYQLLPYVNESSIVILDDIHWSKEMNKAWDIIRKDNKVTISLDLFEIGILFFRKNQPKQDFVFKF